MADRLIRANRTILLVPVVEVGGVPYLLGGTKAAPVTCPMSAPTAAVVNTWASVTSSSNAIAGIGGNISEAVLDTVSFGLAKSTTVSELTVTSIGNEEAITLFNVNAKFSILTDADPTAKGVFNLARDLVIGPDAGYALVDRAVGEHLWSDPFAAGQVVDVYEVRTDVTPMDAADKTSIKLTQNFIASGAVSIGVTLA